LNLKARCTDGAQDSASEEESSDDEVDFVEGRDGKLVAATPAAGKSRSWLGSMMKSVVGSSALSKADLAPILDSLKEKLQSKNVASEIAEKVCMSVGQSLEGKRHAALTRVSATVKEVRLHTP
jgi:signal recognition particle receptor subunit alpha